MYINKLTTKYPELSVCQNDIEKTMEILIKTFTNKGKLLLAGNGGSCSDADHIVGELMKGFHLRRELSNAEKSLANTDEEKEILNQLQRGLPAINLMNNPALNSAFMNDVNPSLIFAQQVWNYGNDNDALLVLSTSGNSKNLVQAVLCANLKGMKTIALTGSKNSKLSELCDITIMAPSTITPDVQEYHLPIYHTLCSMLEQEFFTSSQN